MQEVPFMTNIIQEEENRIALLGLIATESEKAGACPSDETLATFLEGKLTGKARQAMLAHLNHCPSCYYHWSEAASYLDELEPAAPRTSAQGRCPAFGNVLRLSASKHYWSPLSTRPMNRPGLASAGALR
jgi:hypothetical protein